MLTLFRRRRDKVAVDQDVAQLIRQLGDQAFAVAGEMSWREDAGLLASRSPGHWHRVQQEIGRRLRCPAATDRPPQGFEGYGSREIALASPVS